MWILLSASVASAALDEGDRIRVWRRLVDGAETCVHTRQWVVTTTGAVCPAAGAVPSDEACFRLLAVSCAYPDRDGDGHDVRADCDDADPSVSPTEPELCMDGVDQDCDGFDDCASTELTPILDGLGYDYWVAFPFEVDDDLTGDGVPDLVAGRPYDSTYASLAGLVQVWSGPVGEGMDPTPAVTLWGAGSSPVLGYDLDTDDLDGDGIGDLVVGAPYSDGAEVAGGGFFVFHGPLASGSTATATLEVQGREYLGRMGLAVAAVGDVTGDGVGDVVAGDETYPDHLGGFHVFSGLTTGVHTTADADAVVTLTTPGSTVRPVARVGDRDGDGVDDLGVATRVHGLALFYGPLSGSQPWEAADATWTSPSAAAELGMGFAEVGDVDGDGTTDLAAGSEGVAWLLPESGPGVHTVYDAWARFDGVGPNTLQGDLVWADLDGDGAGDLAVSDAYTADPVRGVLRVFLGPFSGTYTATDAARGWIGSAAYAGLGFEVESLGDVDGDGRDDLLTEEVANASFPGGYDGAFLLVPGALLP